VNPRVGDELQHPLGNFILDGVIRNSGYTVRFTIIPKQIVPTPAPPAPDPEPGP
jgi:hypothetical protein